MSFYGLKKKIVHGMPSIFRNTCKALGEGVILHFYYYPSILFYGVVGERMIIEVDRFQFRLRENF